MKILKPKFWDRSNSFFSIMLLPLSLVVYIFIFLKKMIIRPIKFNIPIICIGNIYIGGTGKTPLCLFLTKKLLYKKKKPAIIRKYYKNHRDEHELIKDAVGNLICSKNRLSAIEEAILKDYDSVILDDGFQDYKIKKDINILCFNQKQLIGNGLVFPSGPLRESLNSIKNADIVVINGKKNIEFEKKILSFNKELSFYYSTYEPKNIEKFKNKKLVAIAGIGSPENFFTLLKENNLNIVKEISYPDHYNFSRSEIKNIIDEAKSENLEVIMTEKDYFRIKDFDLVGVNYIKVELKVEKEDRLLENILNIYDKIN